MSGRKRLISALLALAMVGHLGMVVGMAADQNCENANHGLTGSVANASSCGSGFGMHWITATEGDSFFKTMTGGAGINYFYPRSDTAVIACQAASSSGTKNIIIFESAASIPENLTVTDFSTGTDKIILPAGVSDVTPDGSTLSIGGYGSITFSFFGSGDADSVLVETMPSEPSLSLGQDGAGNAVITSDPNNGRSYTLLWKNDQGAYTKEKTQPPVSGIYSCVVVEEETGRRLTPCFATPQIAPITASSGGGAVSLTDGALLLLGAGETKNYTLSAEVSYSGFCGVSAHSAAGSSHGHAAATWAASNAPAGVTVKNNTMTIEGAKLGSGEQSVTLRAAVGSEARSVTFKAQKLDIGDASGNAAAAAREITIGDDSPTQYTYSVSLPDGKAGLYDYSWTLAKKQSDSQPVPGYIKVDPSTEHSAAATVAIDKGQLPKEGVDGEVFVLTAALTPKPQSIQAKGIAAFAARPLSAVAGDPISVSFDITVNAAAAEEGPEVPDDSDSTDPADPSDSSDPSDTTDPSSPSSPGDNANGEEGPDDEDSTGGDTNSGSTGEGDSNSGSTDGGDSSSGNTSGGDSSGGNTSGGDISGGNSSGSGSSSGSTGSGDGNGSGITVTSSNSAAPYEFTINNSSAATVSYKYTAKVNDGGQYSYSWALTKQNGQAVSESDYIAVTANGNPATVTVTKSKLPANAVDETFELTVTATPTGSQTALEQLIALFASGDKTYKFQIRVRAAAKSVSSASSSGGSDRGSSDSDWYQWKNIEKDILRAKKGSTVKASLGTNTDMPFYILDALRGQDVSLQMKISGGYTWTVVGRTVQKTPENLVWIPLGVKSYSNSKMTALCRDSRIKGFQLDNTASFYGDMRLTMNLGSSYAKKTVYLYSYDESRNRLTYASSAKVADNGDVDFLFTRGLGVYAVTSKALYGESAVGTGGGALGGGNKPTAVYPPVASLPASQAPASGSSSEGSSGSESAPPSSQPKPDPDPGPTPVDVVVQPEPEDAPIPFIVPLLILAIAGVITATVVVVNSSRNREGFDIE